MRDAEIEWQDAIKMVWELGLVAGHFGIECQQSAVAETLARKLGANAWYWFSGRLNSEVPQDVDWLRKRYSPLVKIATLDSELHSRQSVVLAPLVQQVTSTQTAAWEVVISSELESPRQVMSCFGVRPSGEVECLTFIRMNSDQAYTQHDQTITKLILGAVFGQTEGISQTQPAGTEKKEPEAANQADANDLPKRQREVLELLLSGTSIREIAADLKISPFTVKDYSRALYRHFDVAGRAELAALFRNSESSRPTPALAIES